MEGLHASWLSEQQNVQAHLFAGLWWAHKAYRPGQPPDSGKLLKAKGCRQVAGLDEILAALAQADWFAWQEEAANADRYAGPFVLRDE